MKIAISSRGSRGDIYPILQVGRHLQSLGHEVRACVPPLFKTRVRALGMEGLYYPEDSHEVMRSFGADWRAARECLRWFSGGLIHQFRQLLSLTEGADVLLTSVNEVAGPTVAHHRGIPHFRMAYAPMLPGGQPPPLQPFQRLPRLLNRAMWQGLNLSVALLFSRRVNATRRRLGLRGVDNLADHLSETSHTLMAVSPNLVEADPLWSHPHSITGYIFSEDTGALPPDVEAFLDAGEPPVYIGFGSVSVSDPLAFTRLVGEASLRSGVRVLLSRGWTGLGHGEPRSGQRKKDPALPPSVHLVGPTPHATLFPRLSGVVHHGGSGTVHNAVRAGIPQFILPQIADQYFWGHRIHQLGMGPRPIPVSRITLQKMTRRLRELHSQPHFKHNSLRFARKLTREDGVSNAASQLLAALPSCLSAPPTVFPTMDCRFGEW